MNFFEHQDIARRNTRRLVVLLTLAVLSLIAITTALFAAVMYYMNMSGDGNAMNQNGQGFWSSLIELVGWQSLGVIAVLVLVVVALGSLFKFVQLRGGGKAVAESLGGKLLTTGSADADQRQLLNVVEEMAIASGTPVPPVYLLDEAGINAFAAGHDPQDAVIGITRGAISQLNRDQLQGVIAHEFSHILHGDMRLNIRLVALLNGILVIGLLGQLLMRSIYFRRHGRSSRNNSHIAIVGLGLGLVVIGYTGTFFGNWIKAAVSRQREFLADASAVQFTRNPDGIAGALKSIAGYPEGSRLDAADAAEFSHMYFGQGLSTAFSRLMATHPPLEERIKRIEPRWQSDTGANASDSQASGPEQTSGVQGGEAPDGFQGTSQDNTAAGDSGSAPAGRPMSAMHIAASLAAMGQAAPEHINRARALLGQIDPALREAAHDSFSARGLMFGLLLSPDDAVRSRQWQQVTEQMSDSREAALRPLAEAARQLATSSRLPLVELSLPALKELSDPQYREFRKVIDELVASDGRMSLMEWTLSQILRHNLEPRATFKPALKLRFCQSECRLLLSVTAYAGAKDADAAEAAFRAACDQLPLRNLTLMPREQIQLPQLERALDRLRRLKPLEKPALLKALGAAIVCDQQITPIEAELFRALADSLDCPVPPMLAGEVKA